MVDNRTREEKRLQNLKDIAARDPNYYKTESYKKALRELSPSSSSSSGSSSLTKREQNTLDIARRTGYTGQTGERAREIEARIGSNTIEAQASTTQSQSGAFKGEYGVDKTPFQQLQERRGSFYESAKKGFEGVQTTVLYNPSGLEAALGSGVDRYGEEYTKAHQVAVANKSVAQNTSLFQQSALGDLLQAGFFTHTADITGYDVSGKPVYGTPYLILSERGKNLGAEKLYDLESNAIWGKAFDFIFEGDIVYMYPEGTRASLEESGISEPTFLEKEGKTYLVAQKEGKDIINVMEVDPLKNAVQPVQSKQLKEFLDLSEYTVAADASFDYKMGASGIDITATGVSKKSGTQGFLDFAGSGGVAEIAAPFQFGVGEGLAPIKANATIPVIEGGKVVGTIKWDSPYSGNVVKTKQGYELQSGYELEGGKWANEVGETFSVGSPEELFFSDKYGMRTFFRTDYSYELVQKPIKNMERGSFVQDWLVKPSDVMALYAEIPEMMVKAPFGAGVVLAGAVGAQNAKTEQERLLYAGDVYAAYPSFTQLPIAVTTALLMGSGPKQTTPKTTSIRPDTFASRPISVQFTEEGILTEYSLRAGGSYIVETPVGASNYYSIAAENVMGKGVDILASGASKLAPLGRATASGGVMAGVQTVSEFTFAAVEGYSARNELPYAMGKGIERLQTPTAQKRILSAGAFGASLSLIYSGYQGAKPFLARKLNEIASIPGGAVKGLEGTFRDAVGFVAGELQPTDYDIALKVNAQGQTVSVPVPKTQSSFTPAGLAAATSGMKYSQRTFTQPSFKFQAGTFNTISAQPKYHFPPVTKMAFAIPKIDDRRAEIIQEAITEDIFYREAGRTRAELVAARKAAREGLGYGVGLRTGVGQRQALGEALGIGTMQSVAVRQGYGVGVSTRIGIGQKLLQRLKVPQQPLLLPSNFKFGLWDEGKRQKSQRSILSTKTKYAPSLAGVLGGKMEKKTKKMYSGFEIRGIRKRRSKHGLF